MIWLPATLLAALFQAWRTAVQRRVSGELSVNAAGLVRYLYGWPVGAALFALYLAATGQAMPAPGREMLVWAAIGGVAQIIATNLLLMAFAYRNFVVGTAYAKTEAIQGGLLGWLLMGESLPPLVWAGIALGVAGVFLVSLGDKWPGLRAAAAMLVQPAALCGLGAGLMFALAAVFIRRASFAVPGDDRVLAALAVLVVTLTLQSLLQGGYVLWREPGQMRRVWRTWRTSGQVGLLASLGSACWFTGFASAPVALVRTVGQVEVLFTLAFSRFYLREPLRRTEVLGLLLIGSGVLLALAGGIG